MEIINGAINYKHHNNKLFLALGNFDGLHLAHRCIVNRSVDLAKEYGGKSAVFLFDPHPVTRLYKKKDFLLLSSVQHRGEMMEELGVDYLIIEQFDESIASLPPYRFVADYLVKLLHVSGVVIGFDYTFGKRGRGTAAHLLRWGEKFGFEVDVVPPVIVDGEVVSSSLIRNLLAGGEVKKAAKLLGCNFKLRGQVVYGEGRGKTLGFPTANMQLQDGLLLPARGVYLCSTSIDGVKYFALASIGSKPTFHRQNKVFVEVYLIDYEGDLYGMELTVEFLHRIREEAVFSGAESLTEQMRLDLRQGRELIRQEYSTRTS